MQKTVCDAFIKDYPKSALFAQANLPLADYYLAKKDFPKALRNASKSQSISIR